MPPNHSFQKAGIMCGVAMAALIASPLRFEGRGESRDSASGRTFELSESNQLCRDAVQIALSKEFSSRNVSTPLPLILVEKNAVTPRSVHTLGKCPAEVVAKSEIAERTSRTQNGSIFARVLVRRVGDQIEVKIDSSDELIGGTRIDPDTVHLRNRSKYDFSIRGSQLVLEMTRRRSP
jgi:hypothetical protein